jgi:hypothetical protein
MRWGRHPPTGMIGHERQERPGSGSGPPTTPAHFELRKNRGILYVPDHHVSSRLIFSEDELATTECQFRAGG